MSRETDEFTREQQYVTMLYARLDALRERTSAQLGRVLLAVGGTPQQRSERDAAATTHAERLGQLDAAENGLCFGRLDLVSGERRYIGRLGILDEDSDYEPLLMDWRAPAARPFYVATSAAPVGVRRRRHISTRLRNVVDLNDDVLDLAADSASQGSAGDGSAGESLVGEAVLFAALTAERTGRMRDVVETIQGEQDRAIRADLSGVLVVQGGPGTGKTAVALHRAAYLLYTHRDRLAKRGVLVVGPNTTFLRYISHVLPALGETSAVLCTPAELYPGLVARRAESAEVTEIKGRPVMADVVATAVRDRQRVPEDALEIVVDKQVYRLERDVCVEARERARLADEHHNLARPVFVGEILDALTEQAVERLTRDPFEEMTREMAAQIEQELAAFPLLEGEDPSPLAVKDPAAIRRELAEEPTVRAVLDWLWPELTPQRLLDDLFASPDLLDDAAPMLTEAERTALLREPGGGWSVADVPLLDEAADLLGDDEAERLLREAELRYQQQVAYAQGVLDVMSGSVSIDREDPNEYEQILTATDVVDAETLAKRYVDVDQRTVAERASVDRSWVFGHVVVDEAQELSPMAWRLLMRRCPSRSMTVVGDLAQTGDVAGASSWGGVLAPYVGDRWRMAELTVNYRTPAEVMAVAAGVLAEIDPALRPPRSVRESGVEPSEESAPADEFAKRLGELAIREDAAVGEGRLAVIVPASIAAELTEAVTAVLPDAVHGEDPDLERRTVVMTVRQAKGLEFDAVVVADPDRIVADAPRGRNDLYVALTRPTRRLAVLRVEPVHDDTVRSR